MKTIKEMAEEHVKEEGGFKESYIKGAYDMLMDVERIICQKEKTNKTKIEDLIIMLGDKVKGM